MTHCSLQCQVHPVLHTPSASLMSSHTSVAGRSCILCHTSSHTTTMTIEMSASTELTFALYHCVFDPLSHRLLLCHHHRSPSFHPRVQPCQASPIGSPPTPSMVQAAIASVSPSPLHPLHATCISHVPHVSPVSPTLPPCPPCATHDHCIRRVSPTHI